MKIRLYGYGFVGKAFFHAFKDLHHFDIIDPALGHTLSSTQNDYDAVIIAVSTPESDDGSCNYDNVIQVLETVNEDIPVMIKSTISLECYEQFKHRDKITFSPEFLRAETHIEDFENQEYAILGGGDTKFWINLFKKKWPGLAVYESTLQEAIVIKYMENSFLALKVSFFNQMYDLCNTLGVDFDQVRHHLCVDKRILHDHSYVTEERGWGGHCLPKDTSAILHTAKQYDPNLLSILKEAVEYNKRVRKDA